MWEDEKMWEDVRRCEKMWRWEDEEKMGGWEDVKMRRCEDEKMWRCEDEKMWRWEDVKMRRWEDEKLWRWEDVKMWRWEDEEKMGGWEDVKMKRCEDEKMWRCEDEKMWRWEDEKMRSCEDEKMWRWEDVLQTPTIGRTLRSDALGKKTILKHFLKGFLKGKLIAPKVRKSADKSLSQPGCSHDNTIRNLQLQKTIVLRKQPQHQAKCIAGCSHFTLKNTRFRAPASSPTQSPCNIMQPFQCDLAPQLQETHRNTHTGTSIVAKHIVGTKRPQPQPPHRRGSFHRRLQPLYTEKRTVSCSGFLPNTKPMQHHAAIPMRSGTTASRNA